jgi:hypothetical protein
MLVNTAHLPKTFAGKLGHCCFQIGGAWAMIYSVALVIPWRPRQRDRFAKFIRSADDVVTVRRVRSGGAQEANLFAARRRFRGAWDQKSGG